MVKKGKDRSNKVNNSKWELDEKQNN